MAEPGTFLGELQRGCTRFWHLSWWWKGPILSFVALVVLGGIAAAVGGGGEEDKSEEAAQATERATAEVAQQATIQGDRAGGAVTPDLTPAPTPPPATAAGPATTFGSGTKTVGQDIAPGTYRGNLDGDFCYFARLSGFSGELGDIIANGNTTSPEIVTIAPTDAGFKSERCGDWSEPLAPITSSPTAPLEAGTYAVGLDVAPGTWSAPGGESCYWQRMSGFSHTLDDIIANDVGGASPVVTIAEGDIGFNSNGCGTWTRQG
jgi:hypothetical protein